MANIEELKKLVDLDYPVADESVKPATRPDIIKGATYLTYIDESEDVKKNCYIVSALSVPSIYWNDVFIAIKRHRRFLYDRYGIGMKKELHAREFVNGRGRFKKTIVKGARHRIFNEYLKMLASLRKYGVFVTNACTSSYELSFDRLVNRISRTMECNDCYSLMIFDEGNEAKIIREIRKMHVYNPIPSKFQYWKDGNASKNITIDRIISDASFKDSKSDYFIQSIDLIAYSLLRREYPTPSILKYKTNEAFECLIPILNTYATTYDALGIVRK